MAQLNTSTGQGPPGPPTLVLSADGARPVAAARYKGARWIDDSVTPWRLYNCNGTTWQEEGNGSGGASLVLGTTAGTALEGTYAATIAANGAAAAAAQADADALEPVVAGHTTSIATNASAITALQSSKLNANDASVTNTRTPTDGSVTNAKLAAGAVGTAAPVSGDGTSGSPVTIADGAIANAKLANATITAAKVAAGTLTDVQVAAANKDGVAGTASLRTLGTGATQAAAGNDARFTDARTPATAGTNGGVMVYTGGAWASTGAGASGQFLTSSGSGTPSWTTFALAFGSDARGDIPFRNATAYTRLAAGTAGQVLKTGGAGADPAWGYVTAVGASGLRTTYDGAQNDDAASEAVSSNATLSATKFEHDVDTSAARTLTLPNAAGGATKGDSHVISDVTGGAATNNVTVQPAAGETINGSASAVVIKDAWFARGFRRISTTGWLYGQ